MTKKTADTRINPACPRSSTDVPLQLRLQVVPQQSLLPSLRWQRYNEVREEANFSVEKVKNQSVLSKINVVMVVSTLLNSKKGYASRTAFLTKNILTY